MVYYIKRTTKLGKIELIRFLNGQASAEEAKKVIAWLEQGDSKKVLQDILGKDGKDMGDLENPDSYQRILRAIQDKIIHKSSSKALGTRLTIFSKIAASLLILLSSAYFIFNQVEPKESVIVEIPVKIYQGKAGIGEKLKITLPDETAVILNSLSKLTFTSEFGEKERVVTLDGEAFFEITPDSTRPFQVQTGQPVNHALGTAFNVFSRNAYTAIALTEGKVSVKKSDQDQAGETLLFPGEMALLANADQENIVVKKFDSQSVTAWKEGEIRFKSKSLESILDDLQNWYGVSVEYQGDANRQRNVTGVFDNESLKNILEGLSFSLGINYKLKGNEVIIKS